MRQHLILGMALLALGLAGCGSGSGERVVNRGPVVCTASIEPALVVVVTDAATGATAAEGATVIATDGSFSETLAASRFEIDANGNSVTTGFSGAFERAGTYSIQVSRPGYTTVTRTGIRATRDECHVITQTVTVALTR